MVGKRKTVIVIELETSIWRILSYLVTLIFVVLQTKREDSSISRNMSVGYLENVFKLTYALQKCLILIIIYSVKIY